MCNGKAWTGNEDSDSAHIIFNTFALALRGRTEAELTQHKPANMFFFANDIDRWCFDAILPSLTSPSGREGRRLSFHWTSNVFHKTHLYWILLFKGINILFLCLSFQMQLMFSYVLSWYIFIKLATACSHFMYRKVQLF